MVGVAQLVEPRIVVPAVVGSSPIVHPNRHVGCILVTIPPHGPLAQLAEQRTLNPKVVGSIPTRPIKFKDLRHYFTARRRDCATCASAADHGMGSAESPASTAAFLVMLYSLRLVEDKIIKMQ